MAAPILGAAALLALAKSAARQAGVPLAKLTKKMIQNMNIPVRFKKLLQGPKTAGEKKIAPAIKSSVTMAAGEAKVGAGGLAAGLLTPTLVTSILSASKDTGGKKAQPNVRVGIKTGIKKKQKTGTGNKGRNKARTPVNRALDSAKKAVASPPKKKATKPKPRPKKPIPRVRPKRRPGS